MLFLYLISNFDGMIVWFKKSNENYGNFKSNIKLHFIMDDNAFCCIF